MRISILVFLAAGVAAAQQGEALYRKHCATCHDAAADRVPPIAALKALQVRTIRASLETGKMRQQSAEMSAAERTLVAEYLGLPDTKPVSLSPTAYCRDSSKPAKPLEGAAWNGWGVNLANARFQDSKSAGISAAAAPRLKLKWAFGLGEGVMARGQAAAAGGRVYIGSLSGAVYSLDAKSGCIHWIYQAEASIRSGIVLGAIPGAPGRFGAYFGDAKANAYGIDAATGKELWRVHLDSHLSAVITATPQFHEGVVYLPVASFEEGIGGSPKYSCCTFRGSVTALDAATGGALWKTYTIAEAPKPVKKNKAGVQLYGPSGAGVWATPTLDLKTDRIYIATGDNYSDPPTRTSDAVMALERKTGRIVWSRQFTENDAFNLNCSSPEKVNCPDANGPDWDFGQPPILVTLGAGKRALVIGQKSGMAHALDPDDGGRILWQTKVGEGGVLGGIQWGSAADERNMYVALSDLGFRRAPTGARVTLDKNKGGGLFALQLATGEKIWSAKPAVCPENRQGCSPAQSAAVTAIPGAVFSGSMDGHLRAYSTASGEVIWDFDTVREYETVNGIEARGGSLDGGGPVIAGGMLFTNSGYGVWGGIPGNVLLAFSVDGK